jgi:hypothetical protein
MQAIWISLLLATSTFAAAQSPVPANTPWQMQESGTTASLRGIDSVDGTIAWASGTDGTVLKTIDGGAHWTKCAIPDAATDGATLDFRGVQAWDATTAIMYGLRAGRKTCSPLQDHRRLQYLEAPLQKSRQRWFLGCALLPIAANRDGSWATLSMGNSNSGRVSMLAIRGARDQSVARPCYLE